MMRWLRRTVLLGVLAGGGYGAYQAWSRRQAKPQATPEWPPLPTQPEAKQAAADVAASDDAPTSTQRWVAPVDGSCPEGYSLKANHNSGIFHVPGGRFYDRTVAERCYASADDAIADGYRPAKA